MLMRSLEPILQSREIVCLSPSRCDGLLGSNPLIMDFIGLQEDKVCSDDFAVEMGDVGSNSYR